MPHKMIRYTSWKAQTTICLKMYAESSRALQIFNYREKLHFDVISSGTRRIKTTPDNFLSLPISIKAKHWRDSKHGRTSMNWTSFGKLYLSINKFLFFSYKILIIFLKHQADGLRFLKLASQAVTFSIPAGSWSCEKLFCEMRTKLCWKSRFPFSESFKLVFCSKEAYF